MRGRRLVVYPTLAAAKSSNSLPPVHGAYEGFLCSFRERLVAFAELRMAVGTPSRFVYHFITNCAAGITK